MLLRMRAGQGRQLMGSPIEPPAERREGHVFVSYARGDRAWAEAIIAALEQAGIAVWWDAMIPGGKRFSGRIAEALDKASAVMVLWSANSAGSDWVQDEAGVGRDKHILVPVTVDGTLPPLGFRQIQTIDIHKSGPRPNSPEIAAAVAAVEDILGREPSTPVPRQTFRGPRVDRRVAIAGGAGLLALGGLGILRLTGGADRSSIAVLPFDNLSGDPQQRYLSDGLAAELRARLSRDPDIKVVGQASSNAVAEGKDRGPTIARKLGVANLLDGNLRAAEGEVRIAIELIDGSTGFSKWSQSFDRPIANLLQLQEEVANAVVGELLPRLLGVRPEDRARSGQTTNPGAFDLYLHGKEAFESQADESSDRAALAAFEAAVARDPDFAAAQAAKSRALAVIANQYEQSAGRRRLYDQAVIAARKAIAAAPDYPDGYAALGYALFYGKLDIAAADEPYRKAESLGSGSADVLGLCALYRARRRQFGAANPAIEQALSLDPLNAALVKRQGRILFAGGNYPAALAAAQRSIGLNPEISGSLGDIGNAQVMLGQYPEALRSFTAETMSLLALPGQAIVAFRIGDRAAARKWLDRLVAAEGDNGLYQQAQVLAQFGDTAAALDRLDQALAQQDSGLSALYSDPFLDPLQNEPRFKALLAKLHFV